MKKGDKVIYRGQEQVIDDVAGNILVLDNKMTCTKQEVAIIAPKASIEDAIEKLMVAPIINLAKELGTDITITQITTEQQLKSILLARAIETGKVVQPHICVHCGSTVEAKK